MTTFSTNTTWEHNDNGGFQAWVNEIYTGLVTQCGLTNTADTGQMAVPCATARPGTSTTGGYYVFRFNDTLQATSPIFVRLDFGTGLSAADPRLFITVATVTDGAGNLSSGLTQCTTGSTNAAIASNVTNYVSRYCYNATQGILGMSFKQASNAGAVTGAFFAFQIFRSVDNTGAPTATAVHLITQSGTTTVAATASPVMQIYDYSTSAALTLPTVSAWTFIPFSFTSTLETTTGQVFPVFQYAPTATVPGNGITNAAAICVNAEIALGATVTMTILGSTSLTYINVVTPSGNCSGMNAFSSSTYGYLMLWQ